MCFVFVKIKTINGKHQDQPEIMIVMPTVVPVRPPARPLACPHVSPSACVHVEVRKYALRMAHTNARTHENKVRMRARRASVAVRPTVQDSGILDTRLRCGRRKPPTHPNASTVWMRTVERFHGCSS